jgi:hypothetical protein
MMSVPSSTIGSVSAWIGKGWTMPASASAVTIGSLTPNDAKSGLSAAAAAASSVLTWAEIASSGSAAISSALISSAVISVGVVVG